MSNQGSSQSTTTESATTVTVVSGNATDLKAAESPGKKDQECHTVVLTKDEESLLEPSGENAKGSRGINIRKK
ncbi:hypothetical protein E6O75_ATG06054 [Venturia nashicola]|uniref:Uncharacterized protein n=1 Tax=Venturia nashicola TaxID=86259 RepID=A0A4Z1PCT0_9PEZI|nr:hypothetical protein E6O75_ATG06054 [Venturia nashicola]